jgi:hypothetical protein
LEFKSWAKFIHSLFWFVSMMRFWEHKVIYVVGIYGKHNMSLSWFALFVIHILMSLFVLLFLQMKWKKVQKTHFIDLIRDKHETWLSQVFNYFRFPSKGDLICSGRKVVLECTLLNMICSNWTGLYPSTLVSFQQH